MDMDTWNPNNFPEIEASIGQIKETSDLFMEYVDNALKPASSNLQLLKSKIKAINYYKLIYEEYKSDLQLRINELPICAFRNIRFKRYEDKNLPSKRGILFITNKRIIFLYKKGIIKKNCEELFNLDLTNVQNAFISGRIFKKLKILTNNGEIILKCADKIIQAVIHYLNISINFKSYSNHDDFLVQRLSTMNIELSDLKDNINAYLSQILTKNVEIKRDLFTNNKHYTPINRMNELNDQRIPALNRDTGLNRAFINSNQQQLSRFANNGPSEVCTSRSSYETPPLPRTIVPNPQIPMPNSINITIPINQNTNESAPPMARVISEANAIDTVKKIDDEPRLSNLIY